MPKATTGEETYERNNTQQGEPVEELIKIRVFSKNLSKTTRTGVLLPTDLKEAFTKFLQTNSNIFWWSYKEMHGIDLKAMVHCLNVDPNHKVIKQKRRIFTAERYEAMMMEVDKLMKANFIINVNYPT